MNSRALVSDFDETYIYTDSLVEALTKVVFHHPRLIPGAIKSAFAGKAALKTYLAMNVSVDIRLLPRRDEVLSILDQASAEGRTTVLATAAHQSLVDGLRNDFTEILATESGRNLKGHEKAVALVERFGEQGFDYVGDSRADGEVWKHAHTAYLVGRAAKRPHWAAGARQVEILVPHRPTFTAWFRQLRPHQWAKNILVFVPLLASGALLEFQEFLHTLLAFVAFCFVASATYIVNDLADLENDRSHSRKRNRPLASGALPIPIAAITAIGLLLGAGLLAAAIGSIGFWFALVSYCALTIAYSMRLKKIPIVDAVTLGILYTLRIIAGAAALHLPATFWLLTFSMLFFFGLALMKRFSELFELVSAGEQKAIKGRGYQPDDLELVSTLGVSSGIGAILLLALYLYFGPGAQLFSHYLMIWLVIPLVLLWVSRAWLIAHRGDMHEDPVLFAIKDRFSWIIAFLIALLFVIPFLLGSM